MKKTLSVIFITFIFQFSIFSQTEKSSKTEVKNGTEYFVHEICKGQTLYGISRMYSIPIDSILVHNKEVTSALQIGSLLYIPTYKKPSKAENQVIESKPKQATWHTVVQGESLYSISRKYNTSIDELKKLNPGISENLSINQRIEVPSQKSDPTHPTQIENVITTPKPEVEKTIVEEPAKEEKPKQKDSTIITKPAISSNKITNEINIALMVPLFTDQNHSINISNIKSVSDINNVQSFKFIQFYLGFLEGVKQFEGKNIKINLKVYDVAEGVSAVKKITSESSFAKTHLIVGPLFSSPFSEAQKWANKNGVYIINPFTMQSNVIKNSAFTFKLTCNEKEKYARLSNAIEQQFPNANVILVYNKNKDTNNVSLLKSSFSNTKLKSNIKDVIFNERGINGIKERYENNRPNVVVSFLSGEATITNYVRRLYELKRDSVYLFCPSEWMVYDNIESEYLQSLNAHFYGNYFVDYRNQKTMEFVQNFIQKYNTEPLIENFGFQGYDVATFFIGLMTEYRDEWILNINKNKHDLLSINLSFEKKSEGNGYENRKIQIIKLCNYEFIPYDTNCNMNREEIRY
ncbi:MAG: LysM peptidoglycan-binding domain-containing protein [Bacteroidales bacterium]|nr:LysM peptidoglycan-binding domain-containing protein [Bacteroidales bacterium]MDY0216609.1 LysM peptidoglycan-binding domain-containing protein [Bacteroidales bacterium]